MNILTTTTGPQEVKFIPRSNATNGSAAIELLDESENVCDKANVTLTTDRYYKSFTNSFASGLFEGRFYTLIVKQSMVEIYRGKVKVTNQTIADYSINNDKYEERTTENEYKYFEG